LLALLGQHYSPTIHTDRRESFTSASSSTGKDHPAEENNLERAEECVRFVFEHTAGDERRICDQALWSDKVPVFGISKAGYKTRTKGFTSSIHKFSHLFPQLSLHLSSFGAGWLGKTVQCSLGCEAL